MTVVNTETGEIIDWIDADEARDITAQAQTEFRSAADHFDRAWSLVEQAVQAGAHIALGYRSPGDYLATEFDGVLSGLDVASRRVAVRELATYGLSTRAIAPVVGASHMTVQRDRETAPVTSVTPPQTPAPEEGEASARDTTSAPADAPAGDPTEDVTTVAPNVDEAASDSAPGTDGADVRPDEPCRPAPTTTLATVTGIDGKTYTRPTPVPKPQRSGEQQNAEENSRTLASSLIFLLAFQHPNQRDAARDQWVVGSDAVSPTNRDYVTPNRMRQAADGLARLADEWESTNE